MAQKFTYETTAINRWIRTEKNPDAEALKARCTEGTITGALSAFPNVSLVSVQLEDAKEDRPRAFHIILREEGYGTTPATINIYCPLDWNGRFLGCTGGGVRTLHLYEVMGRENRIVMPFNAISNGFATANTDGGVPGETFYFGLDEETGKIDYDLVLNLAYRSTHTMTVIAKAVIETVYGEKISYSYLQGASGGGRQTLTEAQLYPEDYDGYWSVDPAINWTGLFTAFLWPLVVMNEEKHIVSPAKQELFRSEAIRQSSGTYDFIECSDLPDFDPYSCVGLEAKDGPVTTEDARVAKRIFDGPHTRDGHFLWYGFRPGTHFWSSGILGEPGGCYYKQQEDGSYIPVINALSAYYVNSWLKRDMSYDWQNITYREFEEVFYQSLRDMGCLECNNTDLKNAADCKAKILLTHAVNDDTIPSDGTLDYYKRVVERYGSEAEVNQYLRLFMTPGGGHTDLVQPGLSLTMAEGMTAVMKWVEEGEEPTVLSGIWYDFEQNAPLLTGKVPLYHLGGENRSYDITEMPAYATRNTGSLASADSRFNEDSTIQEIQADPEGHEILTRHIGYLLENPAMASAAGMTIGKLKKFIPQQSIKAKVTLCMEELFALKKNRTSDDMSHYYGNKDAHF